MGDFISRFGHLSAPCLKHAGTTPRDSITGRDAGTAVTLYSVRPSSSEQLSHYSQAGTTVPCSWSRGNRPVQHHMLFRIIWRRANSVWTI